MKKKFPAIFSISYQVLQVKTLIIGTLVHRLALFFSKSIAFDCIGICHMKRDEKRTETMRLCMNLRNQHVRGRTDIEILNVHLFVIG